MNDENKIIIECLNTFGRVPEQWELIKMIKQLQSNWDSLREWLEKQNNFYKTSTMCYSYGVICNVLDKMDELERGDKD